MQWRQGIDQNLIPAAQFHSTTVCQFPVAAIAEYPRSVNQDETHAISSDFSL